MDNKERKIILKKASQYLEEEEEPFFRSEIEKLIKSEDWNELNDRFYTELSFGTGGIRGIIGGGYNRMNPYVIRKTTQGLADYIKHNRAGQENSVLIAYDSRNYSDLFALEAAKVLCGNGIKTYLFTSLRPTPELSFGVRLLKATAGIVVTASHNPAAYNGYKVYWEDGGQIIAPHDQGIINMVKSVGRVTSLSREESLRKGLLLMIDREVDDPFLEMIKSKALRPDLIRARGQDLKVVYTPLHGTGTIPVSKALKEMGIEVNLVSEQSEPDGDFPTVAYPNPEENSALEMALDLARRIEADLVLGTDPDADRLGIAVPDGKRFVLITGNQLGVLLADYIFSTRKELGTLPAKAVLIKTIVTTDLQKLIAEDFGAVCLETLTGFKYIAAKIRDFELSGQGLEYVFGGEESYGYLVGTDVRDKDAVSAATVTAEMALYHVSSGRSLIDRLNQIYDRYGYFEELLISKSFQGREGFNTMQAMIEGLRETPPASWIGHRTVFIKDYLAGTTRYISENRIAEDIDLPRSNVLQFILADDTVITVRPSGTEPKVKFYASCRGRKGTELTAAKREIGEKIRRVEQEIRQLMSGC